MRRVQLGSGDRYEEGWTNVDLYAERADIRADIRDVEFPDRSVALVRCIHTIEHIEHDEAVGLLKRIERWLIPGGTVEIETPDRKKCLQLIAEQSPGAMLGGAKGLLGGRSVDKAGWHLWLEQWAQRKGMEEIIKAENVGWVTIPEKWDLPGERHCYVWEGHELARVFEGGGVRAKVRPPKHHGARGWRDVRIDGVKA